MANIHETDALNVLAQIVNRAWGAEKTTTDITVCKVPTALLIEAKRVLQDYADSEYTTDTIRHAVQRTF